MTIKEKIDHALEYRYPIKVEFADGVKEGIVWTNRTDFTFDETGDAAFHAYSDVISVELPEKPEGDVAKEKWEVERVGNRVFMRRKAGGSYYTIVEFESLYESTDAQIALMAAAPQMLNVLEDIGVELNAAGGILEKELMNRYHAVIKKARGEE